MGAAKPTIVAVHGAWHSPQHFHALETALQDYKLVSVWLPSMHYERLNQLPPTGLDDDIEAIRATILSELNSQTTTDVLLLAHSYGTIPGFAAVEALDKASRASAGHSNGVVALLSIAGLLLPAGIIPFAWAGNEKPPAASFSMIPAPTGYTGGNNEEIEVSNPVNPVALLYHDIPAEEAAHYVSLLKPQVYIVNHTTIPFVGYKVMPAHYLVCEDDRIIPPALQRIMVENANIDISEGRVRTLAEAMGEARGSSGGSLAALQRESYAAQSADAGESEGKGKGIAKSLAANVEGGANSSATSASQRPFVHLHSIQSSHSPFLSRVDETAAWVRRCAGEDV